MSLEDGARGRKKTGRKESEHSAQCLAHSRYSIFFGVWSSVPGYEVLTTGKRRLRQVYRVLLAGQDCIWFILEFPRVDSWHRPTPQQKLAEEV